VVPFSLSAPCRFSRIITRESEPLIAALEVEFARAKPQLERAHSKLLSAGRGDVALELGKSIRAGRVAGGDRAIRCDSLAVRMTVGSPSAGDLP
jgi:hypothetical protein